MNRKDTFVLLDACVLLKPRLSDVLMDLRAENVFSVHWSANIDDEFLRNMCEVFKKTEDQAHRRLLAMKRRCPEWEVPMTQGDFRAIPAQVDEKDRHVAAAALALRRYANEGVEDEGQKAEYKVFLVTDNVQDLAQQEMASLGVQVLSSGDFLNAVDHEQPNEVERAIEQAVQDLKNPPYTKAELLVALRGHGAGQMVSRLSQLWGPAPVLRSRLPS